MQEVRSDQDFPVLWLGRRYRGYNFNEVSTAASPAYAVSVVYGSCEIPSDQDEGGCSLPYELQQLDACSGFPVAGNRDLRRERDGTITYPEGGGQVVVTGRIYVKVFGEDARAATRHLRPFGQDEPESLAPAAKCVGA